MSVDLGVFAQLQKLWDELPEMACKGKCQTCCGPIDMSPAERELIDARGFRIAPMTSERVAAWEANRKFDREGQPLWCNALNLQTGHCDVYDVRPTICRLWGAAESMPCPHGCRPTRMLDDAEMMDVMTRAMVIGGRLTEEQRAEASAIFQDPELAGVMSRIMRGDQGAKDEFLRLLERRQESTDDRR